MLGRKRTAPQVAALALFFAASVAMPFFHTERTVGGSTSCPACHFQTGSLATGQIVLFHLPELVLTGWALEAESAAPFEVVPPLGVSRAPPLV